MDLDKLTARDYNALSRTVQGFAREPDVKVAYLSNFTLDLLPRYVDVYCAREGIRAGAHVGAFGQYVQEILDEDSPLIRYQPDVVFLSLSLRLLRPERMAAFSFLSAAERRELKKRSSPIWNPGPRPRPSGCRPRRSCSRTSRPRPSPPRGWPTPTWSTARPSSTWS